MLTEREQILALIEKRIIGEIEYRDGITDPRENGFIASSHERTAALESLKRDIERGEHLKLFPVKERV